MGTRKSGFGSFAELGDRELAAKGRGLHVTARIGNGSDGRPALRQCRDAALEWVGRRVGRDLPPRALRHRSFELSDGASQCRAVRDKSRRGDFWAARITLDAGAEYEAVTEIVVAAPGGERPPVLGVRVPSWPASSVQPAETLPPGVLFDIAAGVRLFRDGAPLAREPGAVWTPAAMQEFVADLLDPGRPLPVVAITEPTVGDDVNAVLVRARKVAAALTGLATVTVLPKQFTYTLSDTVTKAFSVYDGAWRIYLPGFGRHAQRSDHPVYLRERSETDEGLERTTREVLHIVADHYLRTAPTDEVLFDDLRPGKRRMADIATRLPALARRPATLSARGWRRLARVVPRRRGAAPTVRDTVPERATAEAAGKTAVDQEAEALRRELSAARRDLRAERRRSRSLTGERDRSREAEAVARTERDEARREARRLEGLVRLRGGDPKTPFPVDWDDFASWCASTLEGRVVLADSARRSLNGAPFEDVGLAAICLHWLGHEYREARLGGGDGHLYGMIPGLTAGIRNQRCGGDSFDFDWRGERHRVDWHLKNGGNTRDPRRCLRIYYFWDASRREVVVASMPAHRRSAIT